MTKEALKLALEALEASHLLIHGSETKGGLAFCMDGYYSGCFDIDSNDKQTNKAITAIKEALAQPNFCPICGKRLGTNDWDIHTCTPPQRTWVGLTDEEKADLFENSAPYYSEADYADAIEAKLKEKNT
jgi:hypothetical protein